MVGCTGQVSELFRRYSRLQEGREGSLGQEAKTFCGYSPLQNQIRQFYRFTQSTERLRATGWRYYSSAQSEVAVSDESASKAYSASLR